MKHRIKRKLLCGLLAASLAMLCACRDGGEKPVEGSADTSSSAPAEESYSWVAALDDAGGKYRDKAINIVSVAENLFFTEGATPIDKAVTERNNLLTQYLGLTVSCTIVSADKLESELKAAADSGSQYADVICAPASVLSRLAAAGLLENLYSLPYADFDAPYLDDSALARQSAGGRLYYYCGAVTQAAKADVGIFYNKALAGAAGVDPYKTARAGALTWSALGAMVAAVGDGGAGGICSLLDEGGLAAAVYGSSGRDLTAFDKTGAKSALDAAAAQSTAAILSEIFGGKYAPALSAEKAVDAFKNGTLGFLVGSLDTVESLDGCKQEWGLLPLPKHSADQAGYASFVGGEALGVAVPRCCANSAFSGFALNALLAASEDSLEDALKTTYVNYYFWSNDAAVMLNAICRSARYDVGVSYASVEAVANVGISRLKAGDSAVGESDQKAFSEFADTLFY